MASDHHAAPGSCRGSPGRPRRVTPPSPPASLLTASPELPRPGRARPCRARRLPLSPRTTAAAGPPSPLPVDPPLQGNPPSPHGSPPRSPAFPHPGEPPPPSGLPRGSPIPHPSLYPLGDRFLGSRTPAPPQPFPHTAPLTISRALAGTRQNFNTAPPPPLRRMRSSASLVLAAGSAVRRHFGCGRAAVGVRGGCGCSMGFGPRWGGERRWRCRGELQRWARSWVWGWRRHGVVTRLGAAWGVAACPQGKPYGVRLGSPQLWVGPGWAPLSCAYLPVSGQSGLQEWVRQAA